MQEPGVGLPVVSAVLCLWPLWTKEDVLALNTFFLHELLKITQRLGCTLALLWPQSGVSTNAAAAAPLPSVPAAPKRLSIISIHILIFLWGPNTKVVNSAIQIAYSISTTSTGNKVLELMRLPRVMRSDNCCGEMLEIQIKYWWLLLEEAASLCCAAWRRAYRTREIVRGMKTAWCTFAPEEVNPWLPDPQLTPYCICRPLKAELVSHPSSPAMWDFCRLHTCSSAAHIGLSVKRCCNAMPLVSQKSKRCVTLTVELLPVIPEVQYSEGLLWINK